MFIELSIERLGLSRPRLAPAVWRSVRVYPGWAPVLSSSQPRSAATSASCRVIIRSASLDCA